MPTQAQLSARLDRATTALTDACIARNQRKVRRARSRAFAAVAAMSLDDYIAHINRDAHGFALSADITGPNGWNARGIATAPDLARLLDAEHERNRAKYAMYDDDDGQPDEAQEWADFDPDC